MTIPNAEKHIADALRLAEIYQAHADRLIKQMKTESDAYEIINLNKAVLDLLNLVDHYRETAERLRNPTPPGHIVEAILLEE